MNTKLTFALRPAAALLLAITLSLDATAAPARENDSAARLLATHGSVPVAAIGRYVERGTYRIQVSSALGRPDERLSEDVWLYRSRTIEGSSARGTVVVRFQRGRVTDLSLVTPTVVTALKSGASPGQEALATASE